MIRRAIGAAGEILGMVALLALAVAGVWLCCVGSGYHWE